MEACEHFRTVAFDIKEWIRDQPAVKEESITDRFLYDISTRLPNVRYKAFSRHEEGRESGADWEWWFLFRRGHWCFRVQAKKLHATKDNYPGIAYANDYGLQIEHLLVSAANANAIPLYAFYSAENWPRMCPNKPASTGGVLVANGRTVHSEFVARVTQPVRSKDLLALSNPVECFACCPLTHRDVGLRSYLRDYHFAQDVGEMAESQERTQGFHNEIPGYVSSFLEHSTENLPDWWEDEFSEYVRDVNALVVYDRRSEDEVQPRE